MSDPAPTVRICQNCGAELLGDHCYRCGQPVKGLVRHFGSIMGDFLDSVFDFDSRLFLTLGPLLFRPGHLSTEYFSGRRVRYVSPVRLFVFLCVATFFVAQFSVELDEGQNVRVTEDGVMVDTQDSSSIGASTTPEEVQARRDAALAKLDERIAQLNDGPGSIPARMGLESAKKAVAAEADQRLAALAAPQAAPPAGSATGSSPEEKPDRSFQFNDKPWDPESNPVVFESLPEVGNGWINEQIGKLKRNAERIEEEPNLLKDAFLSSIPATLFVLLPIFALMLKVLYLFKRRLYMEHLIVALHSHAFLCAALLVVMGLHALGQLVTSMPTLASIVGGLEAVVWCWMPINLLIAQKRIYRQGWFMTLIKYGLIGSTYLVMLSVGAVVALMASVVWL